MSYFRCKSIRFFVQKPKDKNKEKSDYTGDRWTGPNGE